MQSYLVLLLLHKSTTFHRASTLSHSRVKRPPIQGHAGPPAPGHGLRIVPIIHRGCPPRPDAGPGLRCSRRSSSLHALLSSPADGRNALEAGRFGVETQDRGPFFFASTSSSSFPRAPLGRAHFAPCPRFSCSCVPDRNSVQCAKATLRPVQIAEVRRIPSKQTLERQMEHLISINSTAHMSLEARRAHGVGDPAHHSPFFLIDCNAHS